MTESKVLSGVDARWSIDFHLFSISKTDRREMENKTEQWWLLYKMVIGFWKQERERKILKWVETLL